MTTSNLYEHRPTVVTAEAVTAEMAVGHADQFAIGDLKVTDEHGNVSYLSPQDFEANYKPKSPIKELGNMKLPNYPGSTIKVFIEEDGEGLEKAINSFFTEGLNALVLEQHYFSGPHWVGAAFTLNTVVSDDELKERTEIQKIADVEYQKRMAEKAETNRTAIEIAKKLTAERQAEESRKRKETERLAEIGKKCEHNHGKLKGKK